MDHFPRFGPKGKGGLRREKEPRRKGSKNVILTGGLKRGRKPAVFKGNESQEKEKKKGKKKLQKEVGKKGKKTNIMGRKAKKKSIRCQWCGGVEKTLRVEESSSKIDLDTWERLACAQRGGTKGT